MNTVEVRHNVLVFSFPLTDFCDLEHMLLCKNVDFISGV